MVVLPKMAAVAAVGLPTREVQAVAGALLCIL